MLLSFQNTMSLGRPLVPWSIVLMKKITVSRIFLREYKLGALRKYKFPLISRMPCCCDHLWEQKPDTLIVTSNSQSVVKDYACKYTKEKLYYLCGCELICCQCASAEVLNTFHSVSSANNRVSARLYIILWTGIKHTITSGLIFWTCCCGRIWCYVPKTTWTVNQLWTLPFMMQTDCNAN